MLTFLLSLPHRNSILHLCVAKMMLHASPSKPLPLDGLPEGPTTPDLEWPTWIIYSVIPMGSYLMCFRFLQVTAGFLRTGELPHHDHGHVDGLDDAEPLAPGKDDAIYRMDDNLHPHGTDSARAPRDGGKQ